SSVGRSLGKKVGEKLVQKHPELGENHISAFDFGAIVAAASLAHDLGNPPFGHSGEDAIADFFRYNSLGKKFRQYVDEKQWTDLTSFEGNAQGFRLMNKGNYQGLSLTAATLAAFSKYPRESTIVNHVKERCSQKKYGFFQTEKEAFRQLAEEMRLISLGNENEAVWVRHPLAFLVEAADDICYHLIDLEDGCRLGLVSMEETIALMAGIIRERFQPAKLEKIPNPEEKIGLLRAMAIGELIDQCVEVFIENEKDLLEGHFDRPLTDLIEAKIVLDKIKKVSVEKIYRSREVLETEAAGFEVINGLLEAITGAVYTKRFDENNFSSHKKSILRLLPDPIQEGAKNQDMPVYEILMACIDFVASMTDSHALSFYRKIKGIALPGTRAF